jgi:hypothetical protein
VTKRKRYLWLGISGLLIAGFFAAFGIFWNAIRDPISAQNCDRIEIGMTESQVESILGKSADLQYHPWQFGVGSGLPRAPGTKPELEKMWIGQKEREFPFFWRELKNSTPAYILVDFDVDGKVCNKGFSPGGIIGLGF